ncbi:MFS transporter [Georgenia thermotolerans]|uniref:MFS transporter n=1 Tax=Georgenia thermotolerans TaxID=527326 RepID=A0A7J5UJW5_9MICO|nr:MFS transporter [Georgenia thermotolerans]KAE8762678.1 MFS transporter [Georgenia thermotolerans]
MPLLLDLTPLRVNPAYRRLWTGFTLSGIGTQLATTAIGLQVYEMTGSSFSVGLVGVFALVPIVVLGLYGGALVDTHDRRTVAMLGGAALWVGAILNTVQAALGNTNPWVLYALVAVTNAGFAVISPARSAIYPRLLPLHLLPAANALNVGAMNAALTVGPLLAGVLIDRSGYVLTYGLDAVLFAFAMWGLARLGPVPPEPDADGAPARRVPGLRSVLDGLRFLSTRPNVRMTFLADFCAMILAQPRALFPAVALVAFGGGAAMVGLMSAAIAVGALAAMVLSGPLGHVVRQGRAVVLAVVAWGVAVVGFGLSVLLAGRALEPTHALWLAAAFLAAAGAADSVSSVFRNTILQAATPDHLRGRLQGVFIVVVAGGPRVGDLVSGSLATAWTEWAAIVAGGVACVLAVLALARWQRGFLAYDARHPTP